MGQLTFDQRMAIEYAELTTKIDALTEQLRTNTFNVSDYQTNLMWLQLDKMLSYASVLKLRIDAL